MNGKLFIVSSCLIIALTTAITGAETLYITDSLEVAVRAGKGLEYKILAIVKSNDKIEVLDTDGEYAHIRLDNGLEGWILRRYLTDSLPKPLVISKLSSRIERLNEKQDKASEKISLLAKEKNELEGTNSANARKIETLENEFTRLKESCADYLKLRDDHEKLRQEMGEARRSVSKITRENEELRKNTNLLWFSAGGAAVLIGFIIGLVLQSLRYKRRREIRF